MSDLKQEAEKIADHTLHPENETEKDARKRQPFMPVVGAVLAGAVLFVIYIMFMG